MAVALPTFRQELFGGELCQIVAGEVTMADELLISAVIGVMALVTFAVALTLGRRLARRSRLLASLPSGLLPSVALVLVATFLFIWDADVHGDGPAMALTGSLIYAVLALPFTVAIAFFTIGRRKTGG